MSKTKQRCAGPESTIHDERRDPSTRLLELRQMEIDFIPHPAFESNRLQNSEKAAQIMGKLCGSIEGLNDLPTHLRRMCEFELLTHEQEMTLFREMNYLKSQAYARREALGSDDAPHEEVEAIHELLAGARLIRDHIIQANMRLVISIIKKSVTPLQSFDDLLSDGIVTLMQAVEKFDFDRGFRFSTYAYRSISRNVYRKCGALQKEEARLTRRVEDLEAEPATARNSSALTDQIWSNIRDLTTWMLGKLDAREQVIIRSRYALGAQQTIRTCQDLADSMGISKERVRQIEQRAIAKLQAMASQYDMDELFGATMA